VTVFFDVGQSLKACSRRAGGAKGMRAGTAPFIEIASCSWNLSDYMLILHLLFRIPFNNTGFGLLLQGD
jgi:hypothetical protein